MAVDQATLAARVREAVKASGLSQQDVAERIGIDATALSKVLHGKRRLSSLELALLAETVGKPVSQLLSDETTSIPALHAPLLAARAQPSASPAVGQALERVERLLEIETLLSDLGLTPAPSPLPLKLSSGSPLDQADELACEVRKIGGAGNGDIEELASWAEHRLQIDVAVDVLPEGLDGLCVSHGEFRLILINSQVGATRQRYTLAHEIGHLAAGDAQDLQPTVDENLFSRKTPEETRANSFAASFLMPADVLVEIVRAKKLSDSAIAEMLARFKVSASALAFRLHNLGLTNAAGRDRIRSMSTRRLLLQAGSTEEYQRQLQARNFRRPPVGMLARALAAHASGDLSVRIISELTHISEQDLLAELASADMSAEQDHTAWELNYAAE